jgi:hypothetical protein
MVQRPRVLVVTKNTSLLIGLTFFTEAWDVVSQAGVTPGLDADVAVIDLGSASDGIRALEEADPRPVAGAVVIGDGSSQTDVDVGARILPRPFVIPDLVAEIAALLAPRTGLAASKQQGGQQGGREASTGQDLLVPSADPSAPEEPMSDPAVVESTGIVGRVMDVVGRRGGAVSDGDQAGDRPGAAEGEASPAPGGVEEDDDQRTGGRESREPGTTASDEGAASRVRGDDWDEPWPSGPAPSTPDRAPSDPSTIIQVRSAAEASSGATSDRGDQQQPHSRTRWFARRPRGVPPRERELRSRMSKVLAAVSELELLIDEVPALTSLDAIGRFLVDDLVTRRDADCAGFWRAGEDGWHLVAGRGLTAIESKMVVPFDQPLFSEIQRTGGGLLVDPVEQVQAAVAGIGGAHTESFMAAAIAVGPGRFGILSVGRDEPLTALDLEFLLDVALDAAPGIAVAEQLQRIWARAPQADDDADQLPPRSWRRPEGS